MGLFDRLRSNEGPRVAFLGIDGVPYSLIENNPNRFSSLHRLINDGTGAAIESIIPPESSACWPSLTTGVNPGKTGVYGFQDREIGSYETYVPMGGDVQADRVWDWVHEADRQASIFNVPVTVPPQRNVQRMVSGFLSPDIEKATHPKAVHDYLEQIDYKIDVNAKLGHKDDKSEFIDDAHETIDARYEAFNHYITEDDWDLFFGVFMTTDRVNHFLYKDYLTDGEYKPEFLEFYDKIDEYIGSLYAELPDDVTVIVASDHGFTKLDYEVHLNNWLHDKGWLSYQTDDHDSLADITDNTTAYSFIPGRIYINLEGREPRGNISKSEYETVRSDIQDALLNLTDPEGNAVIKRVVTKEEAFAGPHDEIAPDLVALPHEGYDLKAGFSDENGIFDTGPRNGMHTFENATFITDEPSIGLDSDTNLYDITPTILDLMEIDVQNSDFDGQSLLA